MTSRALEIQSNQINQAYRFAEEAQFAKARECFLTALYLAPATAEILAALGASCFECNRIDEAVAHTRASLALSPGVARTNLQLGILCLLNGYSEQGWAGLEFRKKLNPRPMPEPPPIPEWTGERLDGRGILLIQEQGIGDVIHCARYIPKIAALGGHAYLNVPKPVRSLFAAQKDLGVVLETGQQASIATYAYFMDLPKLFGEHPHGSIEQLPYIRAPETFANTSQPTVARELKRVGIAWAGNLRNDRDKMRSIPLKMLESLFRRSDCQFYSLHTEAQAQDIVGAGVQDCLICQYDLIKDFLGLAMAIAQLDLIITVDTAVAHLAGAMGKPVWVMLGAPSDWRWGAKGDHTAWYPSMRLFRQRQPGDWLAVIEDVARSFSAGLHAAPDPKLNLTASMP